MQQARRILRRWWLGFTLLIIVGVLSHLFFSPSGSAWQLYQWQPRYYAYRVVHAAFFGVMVVATYRNWKPLWWVAILFISLKLYRLLRYYAQVDYPSMSTEYNQDYLLFFHKLQHIAHWLWAPGELLFGNNPLSAAFLTTLYVYWLTLCRKLLHPPTLTEA